MFRITSALLLTTAPGEVVGAGLLAGAEVHGPAPALHGHIVLGPRAPLLGRQVLSPGGAGVQHAAVCHRCKINSKVVKSEINPLHI